MILFSRYKWYRKLKGGNWYYNRYWWDAGREMACWWSRYNYGNVGGQRTTIRQEEYINGKCIETEVMNPIVIAK